MASISTDTSCTIHADRRSTARCPSCRKFYCRECITEHEGKLTCATCLSLSLEERAKPKQRRRWNLVPVIQVIIALMVSWAVFYLFAATIRDVPDEFHDGTIWE